MFAVKGWSVDPASLKPQTEVFKSSTKGDGESLKSSKKRKREHEDGSSNTQTQDVGQLWERHIEGKHPTKKQKKEKRKKLKTKGADNEGEGSENSSRLQSLVKQSKTLQSHGNADVEISGGLDRNEKRKKQKLARTPPANESQPVNQEMAGSRNKNSAGETLTPMQSAMRQKLVSARFRHLNETLYTKPSTAAQQLFNDNPEMFEDYHAGFRQQVSVWPENPIDKLIGEIKSRGKVRGPKKDKKGHVIDCNPNLGRGDQFEALPRTHGTCIIADLGCGDARLAGTLQKSGDTAELNLKLHSYDLHSQSPLVTKADISNVPLQDGSVDVAIFCLALMGTNWISFIEEAYRILHWKGELWISEIKSRFGRISKSGKAVEHSVGNKRKQAAIKAANEAKKRAEDERSEQDVLQTEVDGMPTNKEDTDVSAFVDVLKRRGFVLKSTNGKGVDLSNKMFVRMEFVKASTPTKGKGVPNETTPGLKKAKTKYIPELEDEITTEDETGTLKPCLYKIR
jgi:ribosomal RNA-processing protein 8